VALSPHYWTQRAQPKIVGAIIIGLGVVLLAFFHFLNGTMARLGSAGSILLVVSGSAILALSHLTDRWETHLNTDPPHPKSKPAGKKDGFTLVELLIMAIIIAVLAAAAVPLMTANRSRAMVTEAQAGLGTLRTALRLYRAEFGSFPVSNEGKNVDQITNLAVKPGDSNGTFFRSSG
jgi:prepilin-type N-terminal cleavage/methylation domain-containing protein